MQRTCSSCLAPAKGLGIGVARQYSVVPAPKSPNTSKSQAAPAGTARSSKGKFGLLKSDSQQGAPGPSKDRAGPDTTSLSRNDGSERSTGARRTRLDGFLDDGDEPTSIRPRESPLKPPRSHLNIRRSESSISNSEASTRDDLDSTRGASTRYPPRKPYNSPSSTTAPPNPPSHDTTTTPAEPSTRPKYHFKALHHETAIQAFHRPSTPLNPIIKYRDPSFLFFLRATPTLNLPKAPIPPFPPNLNYASVHKGKEKEVVNFGVIASKNAVSPLAPERGRVRKRFKAAVESVVSVQGKGDIRSDWSYLAVLNREVYEADMKNLCESLENGLKFIKKQQARGIGSGDMGVGDRSMSERSGGRRATTNE